MRLVGIGEIAELLNVKRGTVGQWRHRGLLPPPDQKLKVTPVWWASSIHAWAATTTPVRLDPAHWEKTMRRWDREEKTRNAAS